MPPVLGNPAALRRLFANLIDNAVVYGTEARVSMSSSEKVLVITIADKDPGIPQEFRNHVSQPFVRLETSRNRKSGGAGLGLAIAKRIAESHGGRFAIEHAEGGGVRIKIELPAFDANAETGLMADC
jgi:signal transduction histidine kinase